MSEKPKDFSSLGIDIEPDQIKAVELCVKKGSVFLHKLTSISYDKNSEILLYDDKELKPLLNEKLTVSSLKTEFVLTRPLELALKKEKDIREVLNFSAEPLLPYTAEEALIEAVIVGLKDETNTLLTVLSARKDHLKMHLDQLKEFNIEPESTIAEPLSLCYFSTFFCKDHPNLYVINIGKTSSTVLLLENGKLISATSAVFGTETFLENEFNEDVCKSYLLELKKLIFSLTTLANFDTKDLLVTGPGANVSKLKENILQENQMNEVKPLYSLFDNVNEKEINDFSVSIGSALSALCCTQKGINFRKDEFAYPQPFKRLKKPLYIFLSLAFLIAACFYLFFLSFFSYRENDLKKDFLNILSTLNYSYESFEIEYAKKLNAQNLEPLSALNVKELSNRLDFIENIIETTPQNYPLKPLIPQVSDVLAWLSKITESLSKKQQLTVENFNYSLVKRPEINKKQEKYQVKIEFEFTSKTPKEARELHDILITPNDFIDPKGEIKWNAAQGRYKTSFYLKDKTVYH